MIFRDFLQRLPVYQHTALLRILRDRERNNILMGKDSVKKISVISLKVQYIS